MTRVGPPGPSRRSIGAGGGVRVDRQWRLM
jgi:hypothetical protein